MEVPGGFEPLPRSIGFLVGQGLPFRAIVSRAPGRTSLARTQRHHRKANRYMDRDSGAATALHRSIPRSRSSSPLLVRDTGGRRLAFLCRLLFTPEAGWWMCAEGVLSGFGFTQVLTGFIPIPRACTGTITSHGDYLPANHHLAFTHRKQPGHKTLQSQVSPRYGR